MLVRNYAKPFCIAGCILAEIYMLLIVFAPYGHEPSRGLPIPIPMETGAEAGQPIPASHLAARVAVLSVFFGPFGALAGLGVGLLFSAAMQAVRKTPGTAGPRT